MWAYMFMIVTVKSILLCCENDGKRRGGGHNLQRYPRSTFEVITVRMKDKSTIDRKWSYAPDS